MAKFKMELEADNAGITEILEKRAYLDCFCTYMSSALQNSVVLSKVNVNLYSTSSFSALTLLVGSFDP